ncbi:MAG: hypothetical protein P9M14_18120 [Candidatus Alcyoniella australis]|nr:hypothetical protein [Candidatus Alcyoniella australis]
MTVIFSVDRSVVKLMIRKRLVCGYNVRRMSKKLVIALGLLLLVGLAAHLLHYALLDVRLLVSENMQRVPDDAMYYLETADNLARRSIVSFDGSTLTNGFQPLHFMVCSLLARFSAGDPASLLHAVLVMQTACAVLFCLIWLLSVGRGISAAWGLAPAALMFFDDVQQLMINGLEPYLGFVLLALLLAVYLRPVDPFGTPGRAALIGLLSGLLLLSRVDFIFLVGPLYLIALFQSRNERRGLLRIVASGTLGLLMVTPYLAWNLSEFGHLMPISGAIKSSFDFGNWRKDMPMHPFYFGVVGLALTRMLLWAVAPLAQRRRWIEVATIMLHTVVLGLCGLLLLWLALPPQRIALAPAFVLVLCLGLIRLFVASRPERRSIENLQTLASVAACFVLLHFGYELLFIARYFAFWHCVAYAMAFAIIALDAGRILPRFKLDAPLRSPRMLGIVLGLLIVVSVAWIASIENASYRQRIQDLQSGATRTWQSESYNAAQWARARLPHDSLAAARDAGVFAFFSGLDTINLDGVIMDFNFKRAMDNGELHSYLAQRDVNYLMIKSLPVELLADVEAIEVEELGIELQPQMLRYSSEQYNEGSGPVRLTIWQVDRAW